MLQEPLNAECNPADRLSVALTCPVSWGNLRLAFGIYGYCNTPKTVEVTISFTHSMQTTHTIPSELRHQGEIEDLKDNIQHRLRAFTGV